MIRLATLALAILGLLDACAKSPEEAGTVMLATASSFRPVAQKLVPVTAQKCGVHLRISSGSTGQLSAQILNGAPYDVFIVAGNSALQKLEKQKNFMESFVLSQSPLVLWTPKDAAAAKGVLALARPEIAPYGRAAAQALIPMQGRAGWPLPPRRVYGKSAAQAFSFVATGAAQAALVPLSLILEAAVPAAQWRLVPAAWYDSVPTSALLLREGRAARCLYALLQSPAMTPLFRRSGYARP